MLEHLETAKVHIWSSLCWQEDLKKAMIHLPCAKINMFIEGTSIATHGWLYKSWTVPRLRLASAVTYFSVPFLAVFWWIPNGFICTMIRPHWVNVSWNIHLLQVLGCFFLLAAPESLHWDKSVLISRLCLYLPRSHSIHTKWSWMRTL